MGIALALATACLAAGSTTILLHQRSHFVDEARARTGQFARVLAIYTEHTLSPGAQTFIDLSGNIPSASPDPGEFSTVCELARPYPNARAAIIDGESRIIAGCEASQAALPVSAKWLRDEAPVGATPLRVAAAVPVADALEPWWPMAWIAASASVAILAVLALILNAVIHHARLERALAVGAIRTLDRMVAERTEALERASAAKTRFLAAASHDLRQPLQAANLFVSGLEAHADARTGPLIVRLGQSLATMGRLLNALLDLTKLDAGAVTPKMADVGLDRLLARLAEEVAPLAEAKGLALRVRLTPLDVHSDPALLEVLVRNLLDNAVKYTRAGGVLLACRLRSGRPVIEVWDTGIGIAEDQRALIFEEFHQIGRDPDVARGLGLGLAIVQRVALLLGVTISVGSRPGRGSRFRLQF